MSEEDLYRKLFPEKEDKGKLLQRPLPDWKKVYEELKSHKYMTLQLVWKEYRERYLNGYSYSQFCYQYRRWKKILDITLRQNFKGGEKMFVDYVGQTIKIKSPLSGELRSAYIFVAVLAASNYTYAEAHPS
jgi:transposase